MIKSNLTVTVEIRYLGNNIQFVTMSHIPKKGDRIDTYSKGLFNGPCESTPQFIQVHSVTWEINNDIKILDNVIINCMSIT